MGNCMSSIKMRKESQKAITLAIIGLDNAGKTTLCYVLAGEQPDPDMAPTVGFRNVKFTHSNYDVTVFDLGGGQSIRPIWKTYFGEVFGLICVIDSSTPSRLSEARDMFKDTLEHPQVSGKPVLVLANKVDKEDHMKENDIVSGLHLDHVQNTSKCPAKLVMVSAMKGFGSKMDVEITNGLNWLFEKIRNSLNSLEPRIEEDMKAAKVARETEREERKARVKKQREEREKAEELERTQLGLSKEEESEEDDIILGDPFQALDIGKLQKKEQELKERKLLKQNRIKELASNHEGRKDNDDNTTKKHTKTGTENQELALQDLTISEGLTLHLDDVDTSTVNVFGQGSQVSTRSSLEPLESSFQENLAKYTGRKKLRKKKKLTDYNFQPHNNDLNLSHTENSAGDVELPIDDSFLSNSRSNFHDPYSSIDESNELRNAGKISENGEDSSLKEKNVSDINHVNGQNYSKRQLNSLRDPLFRKSKERYNLKDSDPVSHDSVDDKNFQSERRVPNWNGFNKNKNDTEIGLSQMNSVEEHVMQNALNLNDKSRTPDRQKKNSSHAVTLSDEENNSYASHSVLKDTLRFPLNPSHDDDLRDAYKRLNGQNSQNRDNISQSGTLEGVENNDFMRYRHKIGNGDEGDVSRKSKNPTSGRVLTPDRDEETAQMDRVSETSNIRRKKRHNFLRSNRITPSNYDNLTSAAQEKQVSSHVINESGSEIIQDAGIPTKNRTTRLTSLHRKLSHDSDFSNRWGLAEDLPAIDSIYSGMPVPNFDSNDEDDAFS